MIEGRQMHIKLIFATYPRHPWDSWSCNFIPFVFIWSKTESTFLSTGHCKCQSTTASPWKGREEDEKEAPVMSKWNLHNEIHDNTWEICWNPVGSEMTARYLLHKKLIYASIELVSGRKLICFNEQLFRTLLLYKERLKKKLRPFPCFIKRPIF